MKTALPFGRYLLLDRINVGGMAEVYLGKAFGVEGFERLLAIKRILPNMADDDEFINMFVDEARIAVQLSHANIVQVYELGRFEGQYYIAMEYVSGKDLRQLLDVYRKRNEVLPISTAAFIASKICDGLDYAHRKADPSGRPLNLIHRDVSPQNILVGYEGAVKVTDFGIAKAEDRASKTQAGVLKGKFGYMSPEQVRGLDTDHRSDVFAVGILLYEMITGKRLFIGESDFSTLEKVRNAEVPLPTTHNPNIPPALEQVMMKALARERDERYAWASDLADDLQQFLIEENNIYNGKKLAALLKSEFVDDIEKERARIEESMKVQPPSEMADQLASGVKATAQAPHGGPDVRGEKTMIFETSSSAPANSAGTGSFSKAPTQISPEASRSRPSNTGKTSPKAKLVEVPTGVSKSGARVKSSTNVSRLSQVSRLSKAQAAAAQTNKNLPIIIVASVAAVALMIILLVVLLGPSKGTLIITSRPLEAEIFLDGNKIGNRTPISRDDILVGMHTAMARAPGYVDQAFRFELNSSRPTILPFELQPGGIGGSVGAGGGAQPFGGGVPPAGGVQPVGGGVQPVGAEVPPAGGAAAQPAAAATIRVTSEPSDAQVRVGGLPQGSTPFVLTYTDVTRPLIFEVQKPGYKTETVTVSLQPGELRREVTVKLTSLTPETVARPGKLKISSDPPGAEIFSGPNRIGVTPLDVPVSDTRGRYDVRISKDGYRDYQTNVNMEGRAEVIISATLERDKKASPEPRAKKAPRPAGGGAGGGGAGGGGASGGGASGGGTASGGGGAGGGGGGVAKLTVSTVGEADCKVSVNGVSLGVAPFMNKEAPAGKVEIKVTCPSGKKYTESRTLKGGAADKLVVKGEMWN